MQWFLWQDPHDDARYRVFEMTDFRLVDKLEFRDDQGLNPLALIEQAKESPEHERSTKQQILVNCVPILCKRVR